MTLTVIYTDDGSIQALTRAPSAADDAPPAAPRGGLAATAGQRVAQVVLDADWRGWTLAQVHERCVVAHEAAGPRLRLRVLPRSVCP